LDFEKADDPVAALFICPGHDNATEPSEKASWAAEHPHEKIFHELISATAVNETPVKSFNLKKITGVCRALQIPMVNLMELIAGTAA